ncbi:hypothetical protein BK664_12325 [Pseudomonas brassicacearum]|uniref:Uncharacterized protein n=1 Tax=Pseudomonas brassicacearum TaxID=930166 RepID=A0A423JMS4_9PSED|nr:hypothetical protein BK664_12325 [Pseudomonas brassicacearum]
MSQYQRLLLIINPALRHSQAINLRGRWLTSPKRCAETWRSLSSSWPAGMVWPLIIDISFQETPSRR